MKSGGRVVCLEITLPRTPIFGQLFRFYFFKVVPFVGGTDQRPPGGLHLFASLCAGVPTAAGTGAHDGVGRLPRRALPAGDVRHGGRALGDEMRRLIIGMSGASGQIYGIRLLEVCALRPMWKRTWC